MTTEGALRPSVDGGPPTSRFLEGSMNDRTSAAPPVHFLGPEEAEEYERKFYMADAAKHATQRAPRRTRSISRRRERPMSAQGQLQSLPYATMQIKDEQRISPPKQDESGVADAAQKKPGLLGRVRDALFGKGATAIVKPAPSNVQMEIDKRTSLQQAPTSYAITKTMTTPQTRPIPIPLQKGVAKAQSSSHIPQLPASFHGGGGGNNMNDRPSKEEIMASYNELMATGFFKAHAIQSTRQPAPGSLPNSARRPPPMPTIPSPDRPSMDQSPSRPSFNIMPPSPTGHTMPIPPVPTSLPPPPPLFHQVQPKPSWGSFREGLRGRKRNRADSSDDNASESTSMRTPSLSSTGNQIATQVGGIGRRVSKKLRKMPSALASQLQAKSDGMIRVVHPTTADAMDTSDEQDRAVRLRSPSPAAPGFKTSSAGSISGRLSKRNGHNGTSRPPVALDNYIQLHQPRRIARGHRQQADYQHQPMTENWEPMDIDGGGRDRVRASVDSIQREHDFESVGQLLRDGQLGVNAAEPLSVVPDSNRGIPSVPQIPRHYKHHSAASGLDENLGVASYGQAL